MAGVSDSTAQNLGTWTDLSGFSALRQSAQADAKSALPVVAKQFESIFTQMVLKSMRDANFGDSLTDSQAGDSWQGLADQQLSVTLSNQGHGLGIAAMLVRQLGGKLGASDATDAATGASASKPADDWQSRLGSMVGAAGKAAANWMPGDAKDFITKLAPYAAEAAQKLGVSVRAVLSQAALETQWGQHLPSHADGSSSNNLFGMKAGSSWDGGRVNVGTLEFEGGVAVRKKAQFRAYDSPADSFNDYAHLLGDNPRYAQALGKGDDVAGFAHGLVSGGYATDPSYAAKLAAIANSPAMQQALASLKNAAATPIPSE
jgi:flagellar protein FlgJ